jgi:hypothetical protein
MRRSVRPGTVALLSLAMLPGAGCTDCAPPDDQAIAARWRSTLAAGLPAGSSVEAANAFFASHGLDAKYSPERQAIGTRVDVEPADSRMICWNPVSAGLAIGCDFGDDARLRSCSVQVDYTGP